jgi:regulation of enolase protein 1 (concanavalin A-like superfamily)
MWGPANDAKNVLVRPVPDSKGRPVEITASVANKPTGQWEQVDLVWYYDDSNMVKLGQEMVDGQLSIVMGREQGDRTRTIKIVPIDSETVELRLVVKAGRIRGQFKTPKAEWRDVGECDLPAPAGVKPQISLQFYQGLPDVEHWARVSEVVVRAVE